MGDNYFIGICKTEGRRDVMRHPYGKVKGRRDAPSFSRSIISVGKYPVFYLFPLDGGNVFVRVAGAHAAVGVYKISAV